MGEYESYSLFAFNVLFNRQRHTDQEIVEAIQNGASTKVFELLYQSSFQKVRYMTYKMGGTFDEAKDVFQEALLLLVKKIKNGSFRLDTELDGFLYTVSRNLLLNQRRRNRRSEEFDMHKHEQSAGDTVQERLQKDERDVYIKSLFASLGERCEELLIHTVYNNYSMAEIAELMGYSTVDAAKTSHYKCKQRLIKKITDKSKLKRLLQCD